MKNVKLKEIVSRYLSLFLVTCVVLMFVSIWRGVPKIVDRSLEQTVKNVMPSVVHIQYQGENGSWQGSGVIISEDGLILTARHVCESPGKFTVTLPDKRVFVTNKSCVSRDYDVGYLKIVANGLPTAKFGDSNEINLGARLLAIGSPYGLQGFNSVTLGILSGKNRSFDDANNPGWGWSVLFQTDVAANPGNSGGPVFDAEGKVLGIVVGGFGPVNAYSGITYCVPSDICKHFIKSAKQAFALQEVRCIEEEPLRELIDAMCDVINDLERRTTQIEQDINSGEVAILPLVPNSQ